MLSKDRNAHKELHTQARNEALQYSYEAYREVKIKRRKKFLCFTYYVSQKVLIKQQVISTKAN